MSVLCQRILTLWDPLETVKAIKDFKNSEVSFLNKILTCCTGGTFTMFRNIFWCFGEEKQPNVLWLTAFNFHIYCYLPKVLKAYCLLPQKSISSGLRTCSTISQEVFSRNWIEYQILFHYVEIFFFRAPVLKYLNKQRTFFFS